MSYSLTRQVGLSVNDVGPMMKAVLLTTLATSLSISVLFLLVEPVGPDLEAFLSFAVLVAVVAFAYLFISSVVLGFPTIWMIRRCGWDREWTYPLAGFALGAAIMVGFMYRSEVSLIDNSARVDVTDALLGGLPGALCAWLWYCFAKSSRTLP